jgi:PAS domain S-box-containing protein
MTEALRLFLVEDDDNVGLLICKSLERAGHQVTRCRNAADALIVLGHSSFDLLLLDQRLPDMPGVELLSLLAREGITVPVLMVTGYGDERLATRVLQAGALDYIVKDPDLGFLDNLPKRIKESVTRHRLQQLNQLLIHALESARDGIMITDLQGVILHVNQALERSTGYSRQELLGQTPRLLKSGNQPPELYAELWQTILARKSWQGELINRRRDGRLYPISLTVSPLVDERGQLTHFVGIERDITERRQLERQLLQAQKMQSVGTLAGGVAHEFNNLLAGINGYASLGLREAGLTQTLRGFLQNIVALSERAAVLTRQLLTFARKPALSRQPLRIAELLRSTAELVTRTLRVEVALDLQEQARDGAALSVSADANQLQQALVNLALNARDALVEAQGPDAGSLGQAGDLLPGITFRLRQTAPDSELRAFPQHVPPGDYVTVEVADTGCGMTPEVLGQSLDPFFTTKDVGQGTGLGLPMVFGIVQGHQGYLTIESTPGRGTTVGLHLPRLTPPALLERSPAFKVGEVVEPEAVTGRSILVIDDEEAVLDVVRRFLEIAGHRVACAASGREGLALLAAGEKFDLVILDLMMPRDDGAATFQRLRQQQPSLPVLLCTGLPAAGPMPVHLPTAATGIIRKPFRMNELWYAVEQALTTHSG